MSVVAASSRGAFLLPLLAASFIDSSLLHAQPTSWTSVGVGGGGALFLPSFSPHNPDELYVACDMSEMFHSTDLGASWSQIDFRQLQVTGSVGRVQFTSDPSILYTLSNPNDMPRPMKSTDGGITWRELPSDPTQGEAMSLHVDPSSASRLLLSSYSDVYFSNDGGATFSMAFSNPGDAGCHIAGAFFDGARIWVGTNVGLYISNNNGLAFSIAPLSGIPSTESMVSFAGAKQGNVVRFLCVTLGRDDVYAGITGADHFGYRGIYMLDAGSGGWVNRSARISDGAHPFFVGMALNNVEIVYVAGGSEAGVPTIHKSTNAGASWSNVLRTTNNENVKTGWSGDGGDRGWGYGEYALGFAVAPNDPNRAAITDLGFVHVTANGGGEWRQAYVSAADENPAGAATPKRKAYHGIGIENTTCWQVAWADSAHMIAGFSDIRGVVSSDAGATWSFDYSGHTMNSMYRIAIHPTTGAIYAATASVHDIYQSTTLTDARIDGGDGMVIVSTDKGRAWQVLHDFSHPVIWVATDPNNPNRLYASVLHSSEGGIYVSNDIQNGAASTWTKLASPPRTEGHPFNIHVLNDGMLVATYSGRRSGSGAFTSSSGVFTSSDGGASWTDRSSPQMLYWTKDLVIDPHDPTQSTWYAGVFSGWGGPPNGLGGLYKTTDRGATWKKILDVDRVTSCTVSPTNRNEMYVTTEVNGLWHSSNAGSENPAFTNLTSYPFRQPERVFYNPYKRGEIWVTSFGNGMKYGSASTPSAAPLLISADAAGMLRSYPNPVTGAATIELHLPQRGFASITIVNGRGEKVETIAEEVMNEGRHLLEWSTTDLPSGEYFCKLSVDGRMSVQRVVVVK